MINGFKERSLILTGFAAALMAGASLLWNTTNPESNKILQTNRKKPVAKIVYQKPPEPEIPVCSE
jgi:hypothetical protein